MFVLLKHWCCYQFSYFQFRSKEVLNEYNFSVTVPYNESAENKTLYDIAEGKVFNVTFNVNNGTIETITKRKYWPYKLDSILLKDIVYQNYSNIHTKMLEQTLQTLIKLVLRSSLIKVRNVWNSTGFFSTRYQVFIEKII